MENERIIITEDDFDNIKKYLIENKIGGNLITVGTYLPDSELLSELKYESEYKEFCIEIYSDEQINKYLNIKSSVLKKIDKELWRNNILVSIVTIDDIKNGDINNSVIPISFTKFKNKYEN